MSSPSHPLRQPGLLVYLCGLGTSILVLWLVAILNDHEINVMGWYINAIIPAGALGVGILSGLGYAIGSRVMNVKLSKAFVFGMITTALVDYVAAQYLTYTSLMERLHGDPARYTFTDYLRDICEGMSFTSSRSGNAKGSELGAWGYVFKVLEMGGYALGAMLPSLTVFGMPYCKSCQQYLKAHRVGCISSPEQWTVVKKLAKAERLAALEQSIGTLTVRANEVLSGIVETSLGGTEAVIAAMDAKPANGATAHVAFHLKKCPSCDAHHVRVALTNFTVDKQMNHSDIAKLDKTSVATDNPPQSSV